MNSYEQIDKFFPAMAITNLNFHTQLILSFWLKKLTNHIQYPEFKGKSTF